MYVRIIKQNIAANAFMFMARDMMRAVATRIPMKIRVTIIAVRLATLGFATVIYYCSEIRQHDLASVFFIEK